ncbi:MAG TPA: chlorite dismutase family protein [Actinomycetota bacterium]|nr:chlorite dismutase family protein [Actinomycetota bacterium]
MSENRTVYRYALYRVDPAWRRLPDEERAIHKKELADVLAAADGVAVHPYSLVGLRAEADILLWEVTDDARKLQALQSAINATALGRWLHTAHSLLAMTKPSQYLKGHKHEGQESNVAPGPRGGSYVFVYPMDKLRAWYRLPFEERRRMMGEHFKIGHKYPTITIHTGYSFGIDDQEFVVAFEGESMAEFLELVEDLRGSEASAYTARDVPIFTGIAGSVEHVLGLLDGA